MDSQKSELVTEINFWCFSGVSKILPILSNTQAKPGIDGQMVAVALGTGRLGRFPFRPWDD